MKKIVAIVDYGVGNVFSVKQAVESYGGAEAYITNQPSLIKTADRVILPGVGAFSEGMKGLIESELVEPIMDVVDRGIPILGICLGMQMLATFSDEFITTPGLNLIPGKVQRIPEIGDNGAPLKVPYVGWAPIQINKELDDHSSCLDSAFNKAVYFVHSFQLIPDDPKHLLSSYSHNGIQITAAVQKDNVTGVQFHPEKSGEIGLKIIKNFIQK
ncbi:imidazole glycerol phosphate synthase subunit HisH [Gammaproteobacteria bacterium]|nr:imidazole glycerol phosphate synthase subunit HisH [Gammaproteobacteria bacterium]